MPLSLLPYAQNHGDSFEERTESVTTRDSLSPEMERIRALEKKLLAKGKEEKVPRRKLLVKGKGGKISKKMFIFIN